MPIDNLVIKKGQTEPIRFTVNATNLSNLDELSSGSFYMRKRDSDTNTVDGGVVSVHDSASKILEFDPVNQAVGGGNAFAEAGEYDVYVKLIWTTGKETRHPDEDFRFITIEDTFE